MGRGFRRNGLELALLSLPDGMAEMVEPILPICSPRLSGPNNLSDAPLTVEDWRIVHHAYMAFMATVRRVAQQAYERHQPAGPAERGTSAGDEG